jgi:VWFA-related protein
VTNTQFVEIPFTVKDSKGKQVYGLTWRDVRVYENGLRQQMKFFTTDPFPLSVALVIDQSVTQDTMQKINDSLSALQGAFSAYDEVSIFTYNNGVTRQTGFTAAQSARLGAILERSKAPGREPNMDMGGPMSQTTLKNNQQVDPNTTPVRGQLGITTTTPREYHTLNDAILAAARETATAGKGRRRIVYVISDGKEYGSKAKEKDVIKFLQTNKIELYATLVGDSAVPGLGFLDRIHLPLTMRDDELPRIAQASGGQCDPEFRLRGIENSFARITEEVRTQYTIGYYTHESPFNEKFRKIEVRVLRPGLTIISKDGYYPTASDSRPAPVTPSATP